MSEMKATVIETKNGFHVEGYEKIEYDFTFLDGVFNTENTQLAKCYERWGRCLAVMDLNIFNIYGSQMQKYFDHHGLELRIHKTMIGEKAKSMETLLGIVDSMTDFGIIRKEPVLVVGGGLVTDVAGFACAAYRRNTNFIRIPTTVIGLIDASVSIKVAVNYGNYKNRLGAYHAPMHTFLDFQFLRTLPEGQVRNGFAELIKISSCAHLPTFDSLDKFCEKLISTSFGRSNDTTSDARQAADEINRAGIFEMLKLETPNLHEIGLDRLSPKVPLRHGDAISIDMAYSATLANQRGLLSNEEHHRILNLFSRAGLSMDHELFDENMLDKATKAILKTRDCKLRAAVPNPLGSCVFLNDVSAEEMNAALRRHKEVMKQYPRNGEGIDAFVDASDTGYTVNDVPVEQAALNGKMANGETNGHTNGHMGCNGILNPLQQGLANGYSNGYKN
ncbi:putative 3-dehydroquinate synthase [Byssothecium circinans]|uniref:Putative 3-dehydroquinate synthase n=1 Tax=Byssothecium circinans TaxID=147558 RepID=A0A6A5TSX3_9PLEO|nr:putative 3-dehydroquinate synthase [Byssothecium circinans]